MSILNRLRTTQISPRVATLSVIGMVVVLTGAVITIRKMSDSAPVYAGKTATPKSSGVNAKVDEEKGETKAKAKTAGDAKSEDLYAVIVERNLFKPVTAASLAASAGGNGSSAKPALPPVAQPPKPVIPPMPVAPAGNIDEVKKNIAFTGAVGMPSGQQALLENLQTKETKFVAQGESAFGYRVMTISSQLVVLEKNGLQFPLTIGENKTDAPAAPPKPAGGQPGQPGQGGPEGQPRG